MNHPHLSRLEWLATLHVGVMAVFASWAFGGNIGWARDTLTVLGCLGLFVLIAAVRERLAYSRSSLRVLHCLWPLLGLNILVVLGQLQPGLRVVSIEGALGFVPRSDLTGWPSSARPDLAWQDLLLFNALYLPCFNFLLAVRHRRLLRGLLLVLAANALALSIFGSLQKLTGATGLYFGSVTSPNTQFFASFIYRNHWGAFAVLMLALCLGLIFCERPWAAYRDFWHSPAVAAILATLLIAATIPLSGSRACTALALILLSAALIQAARRVIRHQRAQGASTALPVAALCLGLGLALLFIFALAEKTIVARSTDTQSQLERMSQENSLGARAQLYGDTWRMARDHLWFGWGLGSYGTVFTLYNRQTSPADGLPVYYENAHSDWLQWLAELGVTGVALLTSLIAAPFVAIRRSLPFSILPRYLLAGCGLILLYAFLEFPLANPAVLLCFWLCLFCALRWAQFESGEHTG